MTQFQYSESEVHRAFQTLESIEETIVQLIEWNRHIDSTEDYYGSAAGMQLLAANCTLITAIGEGVNRINRIVPGFLQSKFPNIHWRSIIGMRNHIAHGYFELDADIVFEAVKNDIPSLVVIIRKAKDILSGRNDIAPIS